MEKVDVVVVGAGLAGLMAARELKLAGLEAVVLEARDRVGGRTWSKPAANGVMLDLGGQWIGPTQERIVALARELGVETFMSYDEGIPSRSVGGLNELTFESLAGVIGKLNAMAASLTLEQPWTSPGAGDWDAQTMQTWLLAQIDEPVAMSLARMMIAALFSVEADELSLLHVLIYIRSAGSLEALTTVVGGAQEQRFVKGSQELSNRLAQEIGPGRVRFNNPVRAIRQLADKVIVEADGGVIEARRVIVAVPLALADQIVYSPVLPATRVQLHQRVAPGVTIKTHCLYDRPFWRERGLNGRVLTDQGHVNITFDNSPASGACGVLVAFVEGDRVPDFARRPPQERRQIVVDALVRFFGEGAAHPNEYVETNWSDEEWTRGCFGANFPPGAWTRYGHLLRAPIGAIHWAGAETSVVWMNYMDGAVRSGERAAAEVVAALEAAGVEA